MRRDAPLHPYPHKRLAIPTPQEQDLERTEVRIGFSTCINGFP
jgi:hypothetical protein